MFRVGVWVLAILMLAVPAEARMPFRIPAPVEGAKPVTVEHIKVHGASLEGNLEGDSPDRHVTVYLPPDYAAEPERRYPVVYALHGYFTNPEGWTTDLRAPQTVEGAFASGVPGMIIVVPNAQTLHNGAMYSNSVTTGDWEDFIARDLVTAIDARYRTIPERAARGLAGHSMGGYGAIRIAMKHPDTFGAFYAMSPCCLSARGLPSTEQAKELEAAHTAEAAARLDFFTRATLAASAAWSPNPKKPPFYLDLPTRHGIAQPEVLARFAANAPLAMVHQYIPSLRRYHAIAIDVGDADYLEKDASELHRTLESYGIAHSYEVYSGDHMSAIADRFQNYVLPFFGRVLIPQGK